MSGVITCRHHHSPAALTLARRDYDVVVVGAGHAGCEAAMAAAKMGCRTLLLTLNLDRIAWQPCNPAVGGPAKSQLVHEVDALGGWIGKLADRTYLQKRVLNKSKVQRHQTVLLSQPCPLGKLLWGISTKSSPTHLSRVVCLSLVFGPLNASAVCLESCTGCQPSLQQCVQQSDCL